MAKGENYVSFYKEVKKYTLTGKRLIEKYFGQLLKINHIVLVIGNNSPQGIRSIA